MGISLAILMGFAMNIPMRIQEPFIVRSPPKNKKIKNGMEKETNRMNKVVKDMSSDSF